MKLLIVEDDESLRPLLVGAAREMMNRAIEPSFHRAIGPSFHRAIGPSGHLNDQPMSRFPDEPMTRSADDLILEADNLHDALALVPEADAVLSDGCFPAHPNSRFMFDDVWMGLFAAALRQGKRFVLFTGSPKVMEQALVLGIPVYLKGEAENLGKALKDVLGIESSDHRAIEPSGDEPIPDATGHPGEF